MRQTYFWLNEFDSGARAKVWPVCCGFGRFNKFYYLSFIYKSINELWNNSHLITDSLCGIKAQETLDGKEINEEEKNFVFVLVKILVVYGCEYIRTQFNNP